MVLVTDTISAHSVGTLKTAQAATLANSLLISAGPYIRIHEAAEIGYTPVFCIHSCLLCPAWCCLVSWIQDSVIWM